MQKTYVIIGTSAAGIACAPTLRRLDAACRIVCISDEKESPYNKCFLADYLGASRVQEQVYTLKTAFAQEKNIELVLGVRVDAINKKEKTVSCNNGETYAYDALMIATGSSPFKPESLPGIESDGVFTFHNLADTNALLSYVKEQKVQKAVVIGAGLSGLEAADGLLVHGVSVAVVERSPRVLHNQLHASGSALIERLMHQQGVLFMPHTSVQEIKTDNGRVSGVRLASGESIDAQVVICAMGMRPNIQLAECAELRMDGAGVWVDEQMRTSDPHIYAAGDVVTVTDVVTKKRFVSCTWPDAMQQGMVVAHAMLGKDKAYPGAFIVTSSAFFGIKFVTCGPVANVPDDYEKKHIINQTSDHFYLLENGFLKGFAMIGEVRNLGSFRRAILTNQPIDQKLLT